MPYDNTDMVNPEDQTATGLGRWQTASPPPMPNMKDLQIPQEPIQQPPVPAQNTPMDFSDLIPKTNTSNNGGMDFSDLIPRLSKQEQLKANADVYAAEQAGQPVVSGWNKPVPYSIKDEDNTTDQSLWNKMEVNFNRGNVGSAVSIARAIGTLTGSKDISAFARQSEAYQGAETQANPAEGEGFV